MGGIWWYSYIALWILLAIEGLALILAMRQLVVLHQRLRMKEGALPIGSQAPEFTGETIDGAEVSVGRAQAKWRLMLFISPNCPACRLAVRSVQFFPVDENLETILISSADPGRLRKFARENHISRPLVWDEDRKIWDAYEVSFVPLTVLVDDEGIVWANNSATSYLEMQGLIRLAQKRREELTADSVVADEAAAETLM